MNIVIGSLVGAAVGFTVGYFGRCRSGACPLTGNPYISAILGAIIGALMVMGRS